MTAVGGFVDISELVFAAKAGSQFGYALIWVFAVATIGIITFSEMSGRVAAVAKQPVFNLMRHRLGLKLGLVTLVFAAALIAIHPPWDQIARGFVPQVPHGLSTKEMLTFAYFVVAILS